MERFSIAGPTRLAGRVAAGGAKNAALPELAATLLTDDPVDLLGVPPNLIQQHGAVSEPVAGAMASGMARLARTDFAVGITGIAGPGGGTPDKPVGRVVVAAAWAVNGVIETRIRTFNFLGGRDMIRFQASQAALDMVRRWMLDAG